MKIDRARRYQGPRGSVKREREDAHGTVLRLVRLARDATIETVSSREGDGLLRLESRVATRRWFERARTSRRWWLKASALLAVVVAIVVIITQRGSDARREGEHASVNDGGYTRYAVVDEARIRFADGTEAVLDAGARARVAEIHPAGVRIVLEDGKARFVVRPANHAKRFVEAGPYSIDVGETAFDITWTESEASLDVWLRAGSIVIYGPMIPSGLAVQSGQHLIARTETLLLVDTQQ